jgi:hypothetical protein
MARSALKPKSKLKTYHASMLVTRAEEWCVEAGSPEQARAARRGPGLPVSPWRLRADRSPAGQGLKSLIALEWNVFAARAFILSWKNRSRARA